MTEEKFEVGLSDGKGKAIHLIMQEIFLACTVPKDKETLEQHPDLTELACVKLGNTFLGTDAYKYDEVTCKNCLKIAYAKGLLTRPEEKKNGSAESGQKEKTVESKEKAENKNQPKESTNKQKQKVKSKSSPKSSPKKKESGKKDSGKKEEKQTSRNDKQSTKGKTSGEKPIKPDSGDVRGEVKKKTSSPLLEPLPHHVVVYSASTRNQKPLLTVIADNVEEAEKKIENEMKRAYNRNLLWKKWNEGGRVIISRQVPEELIQAFLDRQDRQLKIVSAKATFEDILLGIGNVLIEINNHLKLLTAKEKKEIKGELSDFYWVRVKEEIEQKETRQQKRRMKRRRR